MKETVLGERIKELLEKNNMTQRQLAEKTGITEVTISRYISGKRIPKATEIYKIADALNCSCDYLLGKGNKRKDENMNEIELLKMRLENAIAGHEIALSTLYDEDTSDMLKLLQDCHSVISRIVAVEDDLK